MGKAFDRCYEEGGRVTTKGLSKGRYQRICTLKGKSYAGHIKKRKKNKK